MLAHSIEEADQLSLLSGLGYDCFSIGAYTNPSVPEDNKRPPLQLPSHPELEAACIAKRKEHAGQEKIATPDGLLDPIDWAKADLPDKVLDWADVVICHHFEQTWLVPQWSRIKHKRVIWRTVGCSVENNERTMASLRKEGLQVVRYSPKEENIPGYIGDDALIRFYKDENEWSGWTGEIEQVINITQFLRNRHPYTNYAFWAEATYGLPAKTLGPGSVEGEMPFEEMKAALRSSRAYLYCGTQPASYTLGLIEAMMTGIPVVSIGPAHMEVFPYGPQLYEGHEIVANDRWSNSSSFAKNMLKAMLDDKGLAVFHGQANRMRAIELFGKDKIGAEWKAFLG